MTTKFVCYECGEPVLADEGYVQIGVLKETCCLECYSTVSTFLMEIGFYDQDRGQE